MSSNQLSQGWLWASAVASTFGPFFIFVFAAGFWNGDNWMKLRQFYIMLYSVAGAESLVSVMSAVTSVKWMNIWNYLVVPLTPAAIRHWTLAILAHVLWLRMPGDIDTPDGFYNGDGVGSPTFSDVRFLLRFYVVIGLCLSDLFFHIVQTMYVLNQRVPVRGTEGRGLLMRPSA